MIRISRQSVGPPILGNPGYRGPKKTKEMKNAYDTGQRDFDFISNIYGAKSVKNALIKEQHGKCCFCESKIRHISYGDVEHFRPKGGWMQDAGGALEKPGYYWLAYDWSNLFLSCQICNQRHKRNLFPLTDPSKRADSHHGNIDGEDPLFLNPYDDDPERHIGFRDEVPYAVNGSERGERTIESLGLRRRELCDFRQEYLDMIKLLAGVLHEYQERDAGHGPGLSAAEQEWMQKTQEHLGALRDDDKQYASMVRAALKHLLT